jgi:hypothetical protein
MGALFTAHHLGCKAILALTESGSTALWMSRHNIKVPIYGLTSQVQSERRMTLYRNVQPLLMPKMTDRDQALAAAEALLVERGVLKPGDVYAITCGEPMGYPGGTNLLMVGLVGLKPTAAARPQRTAPAVWRDSAQPRCARWREQNPPNTGVCGCQRRIRRFEGLSVRRSAHTVWFSRAVCGYAGVRTQARRFPNTIWSSLEASHRTGRDCRRIRWFGTGCRTVQQRLRHQPSAEPVRAAHIRRLAGYHVQHGRRLCAG